MQYYYLVQEEHKAVGAVIKKQTHLISILLLFVTILCYRSCQEEHNELRTGKSSTIRVVLLFHPMLQLFDVAYEIFLFYGLEVTMECLVRVAHLTLNYCHMVNRLLCCSLLV